MSRFAPVGTRSSMWRAIAQNGMFRAYRRHMRAEATEVMVIDAPEGAAWALGSYRPQHERTHLICRWPDELAPAFLRRVLKHLAKIRCGAEVAALTLVLGSDAGFSRLLAEVGHDLASAVSPSGSLTLVGIGASQLQVVECVELLRNLVAPSVALGAWFGP